MVETNANTAICHYCYRVGLFFKQHCMEPITLLPLGVESINGGTACLAIDVVLLLALLCNPVHEMNLILLHM
jgi:hypothetical protein